MSQLDQTALGRPHRLVRLRGRDASQEHRAATPLELLFDLTFVVAFSVAGNEFAHALAEGYLWDGLAGFVFSAIALCWAWINYSWFGSAYDTDDWLFRLLTMVQMVGVLVLALGIPDVFKSLHNGELDAKVVVFGYVIMRVALLGHWARAWRDHREARPSASIYLSLLGLAQVLWLAWAYLDLPLAVILLLWIIPMSLEFATPVLAERVGGQTPWHAHHIAERYGLLAIITLGEVILGAVASISAVVQNPDFGWSFDTAIVAVAGVGLCFGMWWMYFAVPSAALLHHHRHRAYSWGYLHIAIFSSIAATGAGLHVAAYSLEDHSSLSAAQTLLTIAIPVVLFNLSLTAMYATLVRSVDLHHAATTLVSFLVLALAVVVANERDAIPLALVLVACSPLVAIVGHEVHGHRRMADVISRSLAGSGTSAGTDHHHG